MSDKKSLAEARRARLKKTHDSLEAFGAIIDGVIALFGGLRTLFDILVPPPAPKQESDKQD
jgi:hypothetical protein